MAKLGLVLAGVTAIALSGLGASSTASIAQEDVTNATVEEKQGTTREGVESVLADPAADTGLELASGDDGLELATEPHWLKPELVSIDPDE